MASSPSSSSQRWFNGSSYATLEILDERWKLCMAPTRNGTLCKRGIRWQEFTEATHLRETLSNLSRGPGRYKLIERFLTLNCCHRHHRVKLEADKDRLQALIEIYDLRLDSKTEENHTSNFNDHATNTAIDSDAEHKIQTPQNQPQKGMRLKSGKILGSQSETSFISSSEIFVPYPSSKDCVRSALFAGVTSRSPLKGEIYSFTWPSHPGFVKIGSTTCTGESRMRAQWYVCHPGSVLQRSVPTPYPAKLERLIHLQLFEHRRKIVICARCASCHGEWFERNVIAAQQVVDDWIELMRREPLFDSERSLTFEWKARISKLTGDITARKLLDILDAERSSYGEVDNIANGQIKTMPILTSSSCLAMKPVSLPKNTDESCGVSVTGELIKTEREGITTSVTETSLKQKSPKQESGTSATPVLATSSKPTTIALKSELLDSSSTPRSTFPETTCSRQDPNITAIDLKSGLTFYPSSPISSETAPTIPQVVATIVQIVQQQDVMLSFLRQYLSLLQPVNVNCTGIAGAAANESVFGG